MSPTELFQVGSSGWRLAEEARQMNDALGAAQAALADLQPVTVSAARGWGVAAVIIPAALGFPITAAVIGCAAAGGRLAAMQRPAAALSGGQPATIVSSQADPP